MSLARVPVCHLSKSQLKNLIMQDWALWYITNISVPKKWTAYENEPLMENISEPIKKALDFWNKTWEHVHNALKQNRKFHKEVEQILTSSWTELAELWIICTPYLEKSFFSTRLSEGLNINYTSKGANKKQFHSRLKCSHVKKCNIDLHNQCKVTLCKKKQSKY